MDSIKQTTYVTAVTLYGEFPARTLSIGEALSFVERRDNVALILGAMRPGYLGREVVDRDDLRRWEYEAESAAQWADVEAGERFDADVRTAS